ncbi:replicase [Papaya virus A]|nr:replicase [Papaya virus A]
MTSVQRLLDQISDPSTKAAYSELCFRSARDAATNATAIAPFAVQPDEAIVLERLGITTSPFATTSHTHAADKILENDCLSLIGHYLPKEPVTFMQIKRSKLHLMKRGPNQDILTNYCHEPKDVLRYGLTNPHSCPEVSTEYGVLSDTLHFMSTQQLLTLFIRNTRLEKLFATLVLPVEAIERLPSLYPKIYTLEYYKDHFAYMPGGHAGGAYVHSYGTLKWLSTGQVGTHTNNILSFGITDYLSLERIETKAAHHIMLIQRRRASLPWPLPDLWVFQASEYVRLPAVFYPPEANVQGTYSKTFVMRMQAYCFSVKAVSIRDIFAKMRQVIETAELQRYSMADLIRLANFLLFSTGLQQVSDYETFLTKGFLSQLAAGIRMRIRSLLEKLVGASSYAALLQIADTLPVKFVTKPERRPAQGADWFTDVEEEGDDDKTGPPTTKISPEDLDLLADLREEMAKEKEDEERSRRERSAMNESSSTSDEAAQSESDRLQPPLESVADAANTPSTTSEKGEPVHAPPIADDSPVMSLDLLPPEMAPKDVKLGTPQAERLTAPLEINKPGSPTSKLTQQWRPKQDGGQANGRPKLVACACAMTLPIRTMTLPNFELPKEHVRVKGRVCNFFSRGGDSYSYTGAHHESQGWPGYLDDIILMAGLPKDTYDHCLVQEYPEGATIPFHSDNEPCYPKGHTILTVNASGQGQFFLSCKAGSHSFQLTDGEYFIMPAGFQDSHKHSVKALTRRISLTFRQTKLTVQSPAPQTQTPASKEVAQVTSRASDFDDRTTRLLVKHGFTALKRQNDEYGPIHPIHYNPMPIKKGVCVTAPRTKVQAAFYNTCRDLERQVYKYTVDNKRAAAYMSDVKNNLTGKVLPKLSRETLSAWLSLCENAKREVNLIVIHGAGGAGKSRALQETFRSLGRQVDDVNVVVPTVNLAGDWKKKMNNIDPRRFMTYEKACEREGNEVVIFDDYGKLPAGYIDAYLAIKPTVELVIATGDQRQSTHHELNNEAQTAKLTSNISQFKPYCDYYINATHRQPRRLANPIRVHAERQVGGSVTCTTLIPEHSTVLVPSCRTQDTLAGLGRKSYTYSGCQGLTLPNIVIALDRDTPLCSGEVMYTAFSRASESITLVNTHSDNAEFLTKLDATPYLKTLISGVREEEDGGRDQLPAEHKAPEPTVKTHLPVSNDRVQLEPKIEAMEDKDTRELWSGEEKTNLMQTGNPIIQLFPHQQAKDEALFKITLKERVRLASPEQNTREFIKTLRAGDLLFEAYAQFMKVPKEPMAFDRDLWLVCSQLALRTYLSKPTSNLQQGAARQDPDFPTNAIALFNKSQWVKKLEKVGYKFKAGQTISSFKQSTVLLTTTLALYLRKKRESHQPSNVFIMCERTPEQFNDFVVNKWDFSRDSYTSDYTQYDQSQDSAFLNFELRKAKHFGVPDEVCEFYKFLKINAKTFLGNLAVMRLSGEGPTFDANTECNIAYDALRFQLSDDLKACYAGDDLVRDKVCPERSGWKYSENLFTLKAKPLVTRKPDFCGWRLTPYGIVKNPVQLYQSMQLAVERGEIEEIKRSYAIDYLFAYRLGDRLHEIFDEDEMEKHQLVTRKLIKAGMKPPTSGDHMPVFHVTSDRLIHNPALRHIKDSSCERIQYEQIHIQENWVDDRLQEPLLNKYL